MRWRAKNARSWVIACLLCLGFWQLGHGAYIPAKAWVAQGLMLHAWDRATSGEASPVPWPWADTWPIARLKAKDGKVDLIVLAGGSGRTLAFGPGHLSASVMPGQRGNSVIAGHRDTHFNFLKDLAIGEKLQVETADGRSHTYLVVDLDVLDSRRGSLLLDTDDSVLSLVTCYPFDAVTVGGPMRYVVTLSLLQDSPVDSVDRATVREWMSQKRD
jgi:sortase A